jgi:hypothetical protein
MAAGPLLLQGCQAPVGGGRPGDWADRQSLSHDAHLCGWALGPAAHTKAARREDPVFRRAYQTLARSHGYTVRFLGQNEAARVRPGRCPVLVWYEHTPNYAEDDLRAAIEAAGLTGIEEAQLTATRSPTGFVVRADAP